MPLIRLASAGSQSAIARRSATITTGIGTPSSVNRAPSGSISRKQGSTCGSSSSSRGEGVRRKALASSGARKRGGASTIRAQRQVVAAQKPIGSFISSITCRPASIRAA